MKRGIAVLLSVVLACAAAGCSEKSASSPAATEASTTRATTTAEVKFTYEIDPSMPVIALTFDDGPNTTTTNDVLDKLAKYGVRASFFLIGSNINDDSAKSVKRAFDMGCEIDNHSQTHSYMTGMTAEQIQAELAFTDEKVRAITGEGTRFSRPPYIAVNQTMFDSIDLPFIAGIGANDWVVSVTPDERAQRILDQVKDGSIILLHDAAGNYQTVEALDILIPALSERGYQFATVSELFAAKGIKPGADTDIVYSNALQTAMY
ncbi:MAG: polysaccharide deacetylase family protein [Oscillospiraceae bacterium]